ncbi:competence type IV pilus ATPase ComGA [Oceanobacillus sp. FSL H7-0719]|uniref:competence type IV pilus ATPase ComGA n=1 Tax=Oceanobacillus sp. FSL H7-0719 TaxID=2954507 RepID=UPI003250EA83
MNPALPIVERLINKAIDQQATDIHFYPFSNETKIYFRLQGKRIFQQAITIKHYELLLTYFKFTSGMDIGISKKPQDGSIPHEMHPSGIFSLRLSTLPLSDLESLAIRILPQEEQLPLERLFLFPQQLNRIKSWTENRSGIILLTGPTGSGKTTTLYALLQNIINEKSYQTITLEDPIERRLDNVLQVQINEKAGITYQAGLKAALRHDPDMIMIGELRDNETAAFAFNASLTGHLVLSTLHAKNAQGTIFRLLEMGIKQQDLLQSLIAVAALQLIPIKLKGNVERRAAILELLEGDKLEKIILNQNSNQYDGYHSFEHLRRKAYAYGFFNETNFYETAK